MKNHRKNGNVPAAASGDCPIVVVAAADVTPLKQAEEALKKNEATLQGILDATQESIWLFGTDGVIRMGNRIAFARLGRAPATVIGRSVADVVPPDLARARMQKLQEVVRTAQPVEFEDERSGIQFRHGFYPVLDSEGHVTAIVSFSRDITESKRAEKALRESEARFHAIAANTPDHILVQDRDLRYQLVVNPQLGLTEADMIGKTDRDFLDQKDAEKITAIKRKVLETGVLVSLEAPLRNQRGEIEFFEGAYVPKLDTAGKVDGLIGYFRNVTARKHADEEIRRHAEELASTNRELARFNRAAVDRELRMIELKKQVNELCAKAGLPPAYELEFDKE